MDILFLLTGLLLGFAIGWLFFRLRQGNSSGTDETLLLDNARLQERVNTLTASGTETTASLDRERREHNATASVLAQTRETLRNLEEKLKEQRQEQEKLEEKFIKEFENLANKILTDKSERFVKLNKDNLDIILNPLKEKIKDFEKRVEESYKAESGERNSLKGEIKRLVELSQQLGKEATNLTNALKGDTKAQGNWGEVILEKVLERSGLTKDVEYKTQVAETNVEGRKIQPDVVVYLPDNKHIIIDSKVSLLAYEALVNSQDEEHKQQSLKEHILSVKNHIKGLSEKNYQTSGNLQSPDFVLMFMPIESSFSIAVQADNELFGFAWERKIVIVSPSTLLATLRTISSLWKQERQTRNVLEIAEESGKLYDKFVGFVEDLIAVGKKMNEAKSTYDEAMKKLSDGKGNLISRSEKLRQLGAKTTKVLRNDLVERSTDNE